MIRSLMIHYDSSRERLLSHKRFILSWRYEIDHFSQLDLMADEAILHLKFIWYKMSVGWSLGSFLGGFLDFRVFD